MPRHPQVKALAMGVLLALGAVQFAHAQSTTSTNVTGRVVDSEGQPVAGAIVRILHVPSGTMKTELTDAEGRYSSRGLRVGGPFEVTVEADGYGSEKRGDLNFRLGQTETVNIVMVNAQQLETVEVVAARSRSVFDPLNMGAQTTISRDQIETLPTINRSLEDLVRTDPRITQVDKDGGGSGNRQGGISAAGQNNRFNAITIDGVPSNDEFGLNDNGLPGLNNAISLDSIEQISVGISNYDVSQSDATGANINAVTRSGTNEFKGSVFTYYRDQDWYGKLDGRKFVNIEDDLTYGLNVGGPIIKDRLFFFISLEKFDSSRPAPNVNFNSAGVQLVSNADLAAITARAQALGFNTGSFAIDAVDEKDDKFVVKLDWNINDQHRASLRWNKTEGEILRTPGITETNVSFSDYWYTDNLANEALVLNAYSDWSDRFSTELSVSRSSYESIPALRSRAPQVQVRVGGSTVSFGSEQFRHANILETDTTTFALSGNYFAGDHEFKAGIDYKKIDIYNLFLESFYGRYFFNSVADFQNGRVANYTLRVPSQGTDPAFAAADFALGNTGIYLQDTWTVNPNLTLTYGIRADIPSVSREPLLNPAFAAPPGTPNALGQATGGFGLPNNSTNDGNEVIQPRVGFNYTFDADRPTQLRGGLGLFTGSAANVWLSNSFTNTGNLITVFQSTSPTTPITSDINNLPRPTTTTQPSADVDLLDPGFKQPTVWKGNLALEHELPWYGLIASAEAIVTENEYAIFYEHLNLGEPTGRLPDGRLSYYRTLAPTGFTATGGVVSATNEQRFLRNRAFNDVLLLRNTNKGNSQMFTLGIEKPFQDNWSAKISYTFAKGKDANPGTSSRAISNWNNRLIFNPNEEVSADSNYVFRDRVNAVFQYRMELIESAPTTFTLFAEGRAGRNFSYAFLNDANGDRINGNDLFYVPRDESDVIFRNADEAARFWNYIRNNAYLNSRRGQVVDRNAESSPWYTQFDLNISQDLPVFASVKPRLFLNVQNIGNLLNDDWGRIEEASFPYRVQVANFLGVENGRYVYGFPFGGTNQPASPSGFLLRDRNGQSRWSAQIGVRFEF